MSLIVDRVTIETPMAVSFSGRKASINGWMFKSSFVNVQHVQNSVATIGDCKGPTRVVCTSYPLLTGMWEVDDASSDAVPGVTDVGSFGCKWQIRLRRPDSWQMPRACFITIGELTVEDPPDT